TAESTTITGHHGSEPALPAWWRRIRNPCRVVGFRIEFRLLGAGIHTGGVIASVPSLKAETSTYKESGKYCQTTKRSSPRPASATTISRWSSTMREPAEAIVIAAAGNYGWNTGSQLISRHSVVSVASCEEPDGRCPVRTSRHRWAARPASVPEPVAT